MTLFTVCGMAGNLFAVRERARESANALMMVTGSEQSVLLMMVAGRHDLLLCAHMVPQPHTNFQW